MPKPNWAGGAQGAASGASAGSAFGPWGAAIGGTIGGISGLYGGGGSGRSKSAGTSQGMNSFRGNPNASKGGFMDFLTGTPASDYQQTTLGPEQIPLYEQSVNAGMRPGAGGAFGTSADYYRDLLSNNPEDYQRFMAPEMRQFNEQIIPGLSEQFAGMGSGGLSSSGFRNAAVNAGTDLSERLGQIRANLRQQGAQGLFSIGQQGLNQYLENIHQPASGGFLQSAAPGIAQGAMSMGADYFKGSGGNNAVGANSSPYGAQKLSRSNTSVNISPSSWGTAR